MLGNDSVLIASTALDGLLPNDEVILDFKIADETIKKWIRFLKKVHVNRPF